MIHAILAIQCFTASSSAATPSPAVETSSRGPESPPPLREEPLLPVEAPRSRLEGPSTVPSGLSSVPTVEASPPVVQALRAPLLDSPLCRRLLQITSHGKLSLLRYQNLEFASSSSRRGQTLPREPREEMSRHPTANGCSSTMTLPSNSYSRSMTVHRVRPNTLPPYPLEFPSTISKHATKRLPKGYPRRRSL